MTDEAGAMVICYSLLVIRLIGIAELCLISDLKLGARWFFFNRTPYTLNLIPFPVSGICSPRRAPGNPHPVTRTSHPVPRNPQHRATRTNLLPYAPRALPYAQSRTPQRTTRNPSTSPAYRCARPSTASCRGDPRWRSDRPRHG